MKGVFCVLSLEEFVALSGTSSNEQFITPKLLELFTSKVKRRVNRGLGFKYAKFVEKVRKSKLNVPAGEKPKPVKTHYRSMIVVPEMVGSIIGVYNGKEFANVEIKFDMIGKYLAEFSMTYKPTKHGRPGVGATKGSQHTDKK